MIPTEMQPPTATVPPVATPRASSDIRFENWTLVNVPDFIADGLSRPYVAFLNSNDSETVTSLSTAQPNTDRTVLYYSDPLNAANRFAITEFNSEALGEVFMAAPGNAIAYMDTSESTTTSGLWVIDLSQNVKYRILQTNTLTLRGIVSEPAWSADGRKIAVTLETGYGLDIFQFDLDAPVNQWTGLVRNGSYNFWPAWSPDGRYLAFVSDRETCPTWLPTDENACDPATDPTPISGHVYVLDLSTGVISQISQEPTFEPPYWINNLTVGFSSGDPFDFLNPSRTVWVGLVPEMTSQMIRLRDEPDDTVYVREAWAPNADRLVFQNAGNVNEIVIMSAGGERLDTIAQVQFARYAFTADWSANGTRLTMGGTGGQCPYGVRVAEADGDFVATGTAPRNVCDPVYSADNQFMAYTGINNNRSALDGRRDVYVSTVDGFSPTNLSLDLRGEMTLLGWVGPGG